MTKTKEILVKTVEDIDAALPTPAEVSAKFEAAKAKEEAAIEAASKISPTIKMAIEQAQARKIKDEYHGFK